MERYCPGCGHVFTSGRNKCHKCDLTTLATEKTKAAQKAADCPDCGGTGQLHYGGQIGSEATPREYIAALLDCTREWVRVLKPSGSLFVNLGDKYAGSQPGSYRRDTQPLNDHGRLGVPGYRSLPLTAQNQRNAKPVGWGTAQPKSLLGLPWRYALACIDDLGLILRAEIVWAKPNGLPESVTDRVRRSHEQVFHFTRQPRYYAAVDEVREAHSDTPSARSMRSWRNSGQRLTSHDASRRDGDSIDRANMEHPLGKLPGSVWEIPSAPLTVPARLGVDHFAAYPPELCRRIILGWSPPGICTACGEGRRPVGQSVKVTSRPGFSALRRIAAGVDHTGGNQGSEGRAGDYERTITGYACACPDATAPTRPSVVVDPFGGTGTTALVAAVHGRTGVSVDRSADYCRLASWRVSDPAERARAMNVPKPPPVADGQEALFDFDEEVTA